MRKKRTKFYIEDNEGIYVTNIVNGKNNMLTILTVNRTSGYVPPYINRFLNIKYMPDVRLIATDYKIEFTYYIYDINFTLENDEELTDDVVDYLNNTIFDLSVS